MQPAPVFDGRLIQRKGACACGGDCPRCKAKPAQAGAMHASQPIDALEREADASATKGEVPSGVGKTLAEPGRPLESGLRRDMEGRFGHDFGQVRVHTDAHAAQTARALNAHAYAVGQHLVFDAGEYRPDTAAGLHLLAHELTHVVQQGGASYRPELGIKLSSKSSRMEQEADAAAERIFTGQLTNVQRASAAANGAVQMLQRAEHGTYVSKIGETPYLDAGEKFYRTWGHPNVKRVSNMKEVLDDLDTAQSTIEKFRIVSHGSDRGLQIGLLPEVDKDYFYATSAQFTTEERFRKHFTDLRLIKVGLYELIYKALWNNPSTQALLAMLGGSESMPDENSNFGIMLRAIVETHWLATVRLDTGGKPRIRNVGALHAFNKSRRETYGKLIVAEAPTDEQPDVKKAIAQLTKILPGVLAASGIPLETFTAEEALSYADAFVETPGRQSGLKKSYGKSIEEGAGGPYLRRLKSVRSKVNENTHIEIRGCNVGGEPKTMDAIRSFFGNPDALPSMSAPNLYQFFFQLVVKHYSPEQQADLEAAFSDPYLGAGENFENLARMKAGEMMRVVNESTLSILATKYGFNADKLRKLNPEIKDPDALPVGSKVWLLQRPVVPAGIHQTLEDFCKDYLGNKKAVPKVLAANSWMTASSVLSPNDMITIPNELLTQPIASNAPTAADFAAAVRGGQAVSGLASKLDERELDPARPVLHADTAQRAKAVSEWLAAQKFDPNGRTAEVLSQRFGKTGAQFTAGRLGTYVQFLSVRHPNAEDPIFPDDPRYDKHIINRP